MPALFSEEVGEPMVFIWVIAGVVCIGMLYIGMFIAVAVVWGVIKGIGDAWKYWVTRWRYKLK